MLFRSCLQPFSASGLIFFFFQRTGTLHQVAKVLEDRLKDKKSVAFSSTRVRCVWLKVEVGRDRGLGCKEERYVRETGDGETGLLELDIGHCQDGERTDQLGPSRSPLTLRVKERQKWEARGR